MEAIILMKNRLVKKSLANQYAISIHVEPYYPGTYDLVKLVFLEEDLAFSAGPLLYLPGSTVGSL